MLGASLILFFIELTICFQKHNALIFVSVVITTGLTLRFMAKKLVPAPISAEVLATEVLTVSEAKEIAPLYHCSFLVSLRSLNNHLLQEAALRAKALGENAVYLNYVEQTPPSAELPTEVQPSAESLQLLSSAQAEIQKTGMTGIPIWQFGDDPGRMIARAARELEVNTVMIGTTKRSALVSLLRGDVLRTLATHLPKNCHLIISN